MILNIWLCLCVCRCSFRELSVAEAVLAVEAAVLQLVRFGRLSLHFAQCAPCPHWGRTYGLRTSGRQTDPRVTLPNAACLPVRSEPLSPPLPPTGWCWISSALCPTVAPTCWPFAMLWPGSWPAPRPCSGDSKSCKLFTLEEKKCVKTCKYTIDFDIQVVWKVV